MRKFNHETIINYSQEKKIKLRQELFWNFLR